MLLPVPVPLLALKVAARPKLLTLLLLFALAASLVLPLLLAPAADLAQVLPAARLCLLLLLPSTLLFEFQGGLEAGSFSGEYVAATITALGEPGAPAASCCIVTVGRTFEHSPAPTVLVVGAIAAWLGEMVTERASFCNSDNCAACMEGLLLTLALGLLVLTVLLLAAVRVCGGAAAGGLVVTCRLLLSCFASTLLKISSCGGFFADCFFADCFSEPSGAAAVGAGCAA